MKLATPPGGGGGGGGQARRCAVIVSRRWDVYNPTGDDSRFVALPRNEGRFQRGPAIHK